MLAHRYNEKTGRKEYALVSTKTPGKVLEWFGEKRPSPARIQKSENRVEMFKHMKSTK